MKELNKNELMEVDGGWIRVAIGAGIAAIAAIINDWDNFERGLMGAPYKEQ